MAASPLSNEDMAAVLARIGALYQELNEPHRAKAFTDAGLAVLRYPNPITSPEQARAGIRGIGPSIMGVLDELLTTGRSSRLEELETRLGVEPLQGGTAAETTPEAQILNLSLVFGLSPELAQHYHQQGLTTP